MKIFQLQKIASYRSTRLVCTGLLALTLGVASGASAQPRMGGKGDGPRMDRTAMMSKRMFAAIEEKTGKPLTATQKKKLLAAMKVRADANKAANEKFMAQVTSITGIKADDMRGFGRGMRGGQGNNR